MISKSRSTFQILVILASQLHLTAYFGESVVFKVFFYEISYLHENRDIFQLILAQSIAYCDFLSDVFIRNFKKILEYF